MYCGHRCSRTVQSHASHSVDGHYQNEPLDFDYTQDEPFSSLDYLTRLRMRGELARLLEERPRTVALVTHDIEEAAQLADRVIVLTDRPARIRREIRIDRPRPRELTDATVVEATRRILDELDLESGVN